MKMSVPPPPTRLDRDRAYYRRLGGLIDGGGSPNMRMSRAIQICRTWRMHFAWRFARALGWRTQ